MSVHKRTDMRTCLAAISAGLILLAGQPGHGPRPPNTDQRAARPRREHRASHGADDRAPTRRPGRAANYMHNYYFPPAPSSTPWAPAWSPDGKSIAVAMSGSIWRSTPPSGSAEELTYDRQIPLAARLVARRPLDRLYAPTMAGTNIISTSLERRDRQDAAAHQRQVQSTRIRCSPLTAPGSPM